MLGHYTGGASVRVDVWHTTPENCLTKRDCRTEDEERGVATQEYRTARQVIANTNNEEGGE